VSLKQRPQHFTRLGRLIDDQNAAQRGQAKISNMSRECQRAQRVVLAEVGVNLIFKSVVRCQFSVVRSINS
jgi:hypothetical protein